MEILDLSARCGRIEGRIKTKAFIPHKFLPPCIRCIGDNQYFIGLPEADYFLLSDMIAYVIDLEIKLYREKGFIEAAINTVKSMEFDNLSNL